MRDAARHDELVLKGSAAHVREENLRLRNLSAQRRFQRSDLRNLAFQPLVARNEQAAVGKDPCINRRNSSFFNELSLCLNGCQSLSWQKDRVCAA